MFRKSAQELPVWYCSSFFIFRVLQGEPGAAELGANTDANHTCAIFLKYFLTDVFLFDAN